MGYRWTMLATSRFGQLIGLERMYLSQARKQLANETEDDRIQRKLGGLLNDRMSIGFRIAAAVELGRMPQFDTADLLLALYREEPGGWETMEMLKEAIDRIDPAVLDAFKARHSGLAADRDSEETLRRCWQADALNKDRLASAAIDHLREAGERGSFALAHLIEKMISCRSRDLPAALHLAGSATLSADLAATLRSIAYTPQSKAGRLPPGTPETFGAGRYGWTDETYRRVQELAWQALNRPRGSPAEIPVNLTPRPAS